MDILITISISIVAIEHIYFLILEMLFWTKPKGIKTFGLKSKEFAEDTKVLAANQGLYNGFLAAGLIYSLVIEDKNLSILFLVFVTIAAIYGSYSTQKVRLFFIQGIPALIALIFILISN